MKQESLSKQVGTTSRLVPFRAPLGSSQKNFHVSLMLH